MTLFRGLIALLRGCRRLQVPQFGVILVLLPQLALAKICDEELLKKGLLDSKNPAANRSAIVSHARAHTLPAFEVELNDEWVPVVLLNKKTIRQWDFVLNETMGMAQMLTAGNGADHGNMRLPGIAGKGQPFRAPHAILESESPSGALMDLFSPLQAGPGAAAGTGYRFKPLGDYFERRKPNSNEFVDLSYALSPTARTQIWLYHAVKRSGLVRIHYMFDEQNNAWFLQQRRSLLWDRSAEHCNNSRCAHTAPGHIAEIRERLNGLLAKDTDVVLSSDKTQAFLDAAKKDLLGRDWRDNKTYDPDFLNRPEYLDLMREFLKPELSHEQQVDAVSYLLALNVFQEAHAIKKQLEIHEGQLNQYGNPNISVIFIYSDYAENVARFFEGNLQLASAPLEHGNNGFRTSFFKVRRIFAELPSDDALKKSQP